MTLMVRETFINATKGYQFGDGEWYEAWTNDRGKLYKSLQREYGRAQAMYRDPDARHSGTRTVGWVFTKRMKYEDARSNRPEDYYIREVWVEVRDTEGEGAKPDLRAYDIRQEARAHAGRGQHRRRRRTLTRGRDR